MSRRQPSQKWGDRVATSPPTTEANAPRLDLEALYRDEAGQLVRVIARHSRDDPRDFVHDAFVRLAELQQGMRLHRPAAYLRRIADNLLNDRRRSDKRRRLESHVAADDGTLPPFDPHAQLESRDMLRRIETAMQRLPEKTRRIFIAHRVEGLSYAEIAMRTGLTIKGVEKQMSKALVLIDRMLARR